MIVFDPHQRAIFKNWPDARPLPEGAVVCPTEAEARALASLLGPGADAPPAPADYPITKDTIVWRMKQMGKLTQLMAFTAAMDDLRRYEYQESVYFDRSTWAQYIGFFGLTAEETAFLLSPDDSPLLTL